MKIKLIHYAAPPVVGGVETVLARQAEVFTDAGHETAVIAGRGAQWKPGIPVYRVDRIDSRHPDVLRFKTSLDSGTVPDGFNVFVEEIVQDLDALYRDADWVIAHNIASLHKNLALTAALHRLAVMYPKTGLVLWHHDLAWVMKNYASELHPGWPWDLLRTPWLNVKQVVVSEARKTDLVNLMKLPPGDVRVIPAGVDLNEFLNLQTSTRALAQQLNLELAAPLLLSPVRLTRRKNIELGLQITAELVKVFPETHYVVTGPLGAHNPANAEYFQLLLKMRADLGLGKTVHFLAEYLPDGLTDGQVADFYRLADVLLITSKEEGFGIPILEGGLGRLPIFCSDIPSLKALAGRYANYFSLETPPSLISQQLTNYLRTDSIYQLRTQVRQHYTWPAIYQNDLMPLLNRSA